MMAPPGESAPYDGPPPGEGAPYDGLYEEAPTERGTFFRLLGSTEICHLGL